MTKLNKSRLSGIISGIVFSVITFAILVLLDLKIADWKFTVLYFIISLSLGNAYIFIRAYYDLLKNK